MNEPKQMLDYRAPELRPGRPDSGLSVALGVLSLGCVAVPVAGFVMRSGPLYLCGGALAPLVGLFLATVSIICGRAGAGAAVGWFALLVNGLVATYFVWLFFVHGLC